MDSFSRLPGAPVDLTLTETPAGQKFLQHRASMQKWNNELQSYLTNDNRPRGLANASEITLVDATKDDAAVCRELLWHLDVVITLIVVQCAVCVCGVRWRPSTR